MSDRDTDPSDTDSSDTDPRDRDANRSGGKHVQDERPDGNDAEPRTDDDGLSALAKDVSHPFDQTNGLVDGLEGNEDDPETMNEKLDQRADRPDGRVPGIPLAGTSGGQPGVAPPPDFGRDDLSEDDKRKTDTDEPQGP